MPPLPEDALAQKPQNPEPRPEPPLEVVDREEGLNTVPATPVVITPRVDPPQANYFPPAMPEEVPKASQTVPQHHTALKQFENPPEEPSAVPKQTRTYSSTSSTAVDQLPPAFEDIMPKATTSTLKVNLDPHSRWREKLGIYGSKLEEIRRNRQTRASPATLLGTPPNLPGVILAPISGSSTAQSVTPQPQRSPEIQKEKQSNVSTGNRENAKRTNSTPKDGDTGEFGPSPNMSVIPKVTRNRRERETEDREDLR